MNSTTAINTKMKREKFKRRQLWIDGDLQLGLAKELGVVLILGVVLGVANVHVMSAFGDLYSPGDSAGYWDDAGLVWVYTAAMAIASIGMIFIVSVFYSHRVAGPAAKLSSHLQRLAEGGGIRPVTLRKHDHLKDLCDDINYLSATWNKTLREIAHIAGELDKIADVDERVRIHVEQLKKSVERASAKPE